MVHFVSLTQAAQDGNGILDARLVHVDRLEAAFEGRVFLNVLAVFVERCGADAVQLSARQHGLQQVAGVHGALGFTRTDHCMQFVDEQNNLALRRLHFLENSLEPLFELAPKLRARDQRAHVQRYHALVLQTFGNVATHDASG